MGLHPNFNDRSSPQGFQFEFQCDRCASRFLSKLQISKVGVARGLFGSAAKWLGGNVQQAAGIGDQIGEALGKGARETALRTAVAEMDTQLKHCPRCGKWVCVEGCWNARRGMCESCAPDTAEEAAAAQALAEQKQVTEVAAKVQRITE